MQNQAIQTLTLPPLDTSTYSGLAGLLSNPAYLAHAEQVFTHGGKLDPKAVSNLKSCAEGTINTLGNLQAVFAKLVMANTEARTWVVPDAEIAFAQFELSVMLGEVMPLLHHIYNTFQSDLDR
ncbi:hypothetical protein [Conchiformibius steedae]|uniref:Uncharacterized protein n=1 Tax=Conchiformibius steedae TaxID=153493 RepID=A0A3P1ZYL3_9NEIS|nr:hypothetical protein [Conchiformibius steedae]RRD88217.1 hypothetical protein EII21_11425 [Conchiformibius steedae]